MKITTNLTEIKELFAHHLGINVSELELTVEDTQSEATVGGWIINTQTKPMVPETLNSDDEIEVILSDNKIFLGAVNCWDKSWNINDKSRHIVKYRKVNK